MNKYFILTFLSAALLTNSAYADSITDSWLGEWGYWKSSTGSSISIYNCDKVNHICQFRLDYVGDPNSENGFEHLSGILSIQSNTQAVATKFNSFFHPGVVDYDSSHCPGGIQFNLQNNIISITYAKDCEINDVPKLYAFKTHNNYPGHDVGRSSLYNHCYDQNKSAVFNTWCNNSEIFQLDLTTNEMYKHLWQSHELFNLNIPQKEFDQKILNWRDLILATCKSDPHILECLKKNYQQSVITAKNLEKGVQKVIKDRSDRYAELQKAGEPSKGSKLIDKIDGVYKAHHVYHPADGGKTKKLENILEIVKVATNSIYFRLSIDYGDTECHMHGIAYYTDKNYFIYHQNDNDVNCLLKIIPSAKGITLKDVDDDKTCQAYCDPIERVPNEFFAADQRKTIRYMTRLKDSEEYKSAVGGKKDQG